MTAREFAFIVSRAMGIYLFIEGMYIVSTNVWVAGTLRNNEPEKWFFVAVLGLFSLVYASFALWLWVKAPGGSPASWWNGSRNSHPQARNANSTLSP